MKLIRRLTALVLTALLLAAPVTAAAPRFSDVPEKHWAYESVCRAAELGLVSGDNKGRFGLGKSVTRAEYATMLCRLMGWELISPEQGSFADNQNPKAWYYSAIETAAAHGVLPKLGENAGVTEPLRREELASMTVRALGYSALAGLVQDDCPFEDVTVNRGYVTVAYHMGFMNGGTGNLFSPDAPAAREQAAAVLLRVYDRMHAPLACLPVSALPEGETAVWAEPISERSGRIPMEPRAPLENVYAAALAAGEGGAVALHTEAYHATNRRALREGELEQLLADEDARVYRSTRYESSYLVRNGTVVWFETEADIAEKVMLCRLLGVSTVYLA